MNINLCLISHTNVGKTSLARTLLHRDIGQSLDQAHVTDTSDVHELVSNAAGDALLLWDTPGLGDSARLLKRLSRSDDPVGWLMTQVWDRWVDRPLYSSQKALRAVREQCDVVLYLVNASEGATSSGYVDVEMQIVGWMGKPVLVLLNQVGLPSGHSGGAADVEAWRAHLGGYPWVKKVLSLDAFTRVWVQENVLLLNVSACLPPAMQPVMDGLRAEWKRRNFEVFEQSMGCLARQLALDAVDSEKILSRGWAQGLRDLLVTLSPGRAANTPPVVATAMNALARRADEALRASTQQLIRLHGLSGEAAGEIETRLATQFTLSEAVDPAKAGLLGAVLTGALGGLAADVASGGMTLGTGALVGGVLGLLGASGAAQAYNVARGGDQDQVRWSPDFLMQRAESAVLRYLAVAHFGRARGPWSEGRYPSHWPATVHAAAEPYHGRLGDVWAAARENPPRSDLTVDPYVHILQPIIRALVADVLGKLYPHALDLGGPSPVLPPRPPALTSAQP